MRKTIQQRFGENIADEFCKHAKIKFNLSLQK